jgi:hypothetical protein
MINLQASATKLKIKLKPRFRPLFLLDLYDLSVMTRNINTCPLLRDQLLPQDLYQKAANPPQS